MADVSVTAANVARVASSGVAGQDTQIDNGFAGASITAGQSVYKDANGVYQLADANLSAVAAVTKGIALNGAASGQPLAVAIGGTMNPGFTVTVGTIYVQSATAGGIAPSTDLTTGWRTTVIGVGLTSTSLGLVMYSSGVAVP